MSSSLKAHLMTSGYHRVALRRSRTGQLLVDARLGSAGLSMILDSGASATVLDLESADRLGLARVDAERCGVGAGGQVDTFVTQAGELVLGSIAVSVGPLPVIDFGHVNQRLIAIGEPQVDGVIGADVLREHAAVLEYESPALYLRREPRPRPGKAEPGTSAA
jgi:predicted aspartyl protease